MDDPHQGIPRVAARPLSETGSEAHVVQFYEDADLFLHTVGDLIGRGIENGQAGIVIATLPHRAAVEKVLARRGLDIRTEQERGTYLPLDARELLDGFLRDGWPDARLFEEVVGETVRHAGGAGAGPIPVRAFGEMVALLVAEGRVDAAVRLEELWNDLGRRLSFSLLCGYPIAQFADTRRERPFGVISGAHSRVVPTETYLGIAGHDARLREIAALQQKARALEGEIATRRRLEEELHDKLEELADLDRRKDEFLAMLGHELRNPLAPVTSALHLMRLHSDDAARVARARETIERQIAHMSRLVNDLLDVSRITRGKIELREETTVLAEVVDRAVETARPFIDERGHRLALQLPDEPVVFLADPARMGQVLANLLHNAAKYTDVGGHIWLRAEKHEDELIISVKDDGVGIAPEHRDSVFDLFVQAPAARARDGGGLGIGLTLVRRLVELHGGSITAKSDGPGTGSEFVVRFPLRPVRVPAGPRPLDAPAPGLRRRILIVDDNVDASEALSELLREYGHSAWNVHSGVAALDLAASVRPDVVLLDIGMPEMDGYEVARRLRADPALHGAILVALTGYGEEHHRLRSHDAGFDHHVTKPIDVDQLEDLLRPHSLTDR